MAEQSQRFTTIVTAISVVVAAAIGSPFIVEWYKTHHATAATATAIKGRVITHIRVGDPTALSERATAHLRENGIEIAATRPVDRDKSPSASEVRYYFDSDEALAHRVAGLLAESDVPASARDFSRYKESRTPERGVVEIWFALK